MFRADQSFTIRALTSARRLMSTGLALALIASTASQPVNAQTFDENGENTEILQVVGKQFPTGRSTRSRSSSSGNQPSLFGGLFSLGSSDSGSSGKKDDEYRKVTPLNEDRAPADWSGIPYHQGSGSTSVATTRQPLSDPGRGGQVAQTRPQAAVPQPQIVGSGSARPATVPTPIPTPQRTASAPPAKLPTPPPLASATPPARRSLPVQINSSADESNRPEPLSMTRSSRRTVEPEAQKVVVKPQPLRVVAEPTPSECVDVVELIPRVSRRIINVEKSEPTKSELADAPAPEVSSRRAIVENPAPTKPSPALAASSPAAVTTSAPVAMKAPSVAAPAPVPLVAEPKSPAAASSANNASVVSGRMNTFGRIDANAPHPDARASGNLEKPSGEIALQPLSDRLPVDDQDSFDARSKDGTGVATLHQDVTSKPNVRTSDATELPGIRVSTAGPSQVMIRQTHTYEIRVENRGSVDAEGLIVRAHIPDWADVVGQQTTRGDVTSATEESTRSLKWKIEQLPAGASEKLMVRLKAARSGTHDLDVDWTMTPRKKVVTVQVREPQLALTIDGPDEVIFGQSRTYRIRVLNPGDGIAPNVMFTLSPESNSPQSQRIGDIPSGKEAQFEVELTAQDLGELKIHGVAIGEYDLKAQAAKTVKVLSADLEAIFNGPELKYQNATASYQLELINNGTAPSENVIATLDLPPGVSYVGGLNEAPMVDKQLRWKIASMPVGSRRQYEFQCKMEATGRQEFAFDCKGSAAGKTAVAISTDVQAIADLVLAIEDPMAPAPIGQDVNYTIVIHNRGSKAAMDVKAVAQFSNGIEPQRLTGHTGKVITGQVLIDAIPQINPGEEVRMTVVARAETGGHHRFRTEIRSGDTVLVAEEATQYLQPSRERITRRSGEGAAFQPSLR